MCIKKLLVAAAALAGMMLGTGEAKADYLCSVRYSPNGGSAGNEGFVGATVYSGANCTGILVGSYTFCTTAATSSSCALNAGWRYERQGILALFQTLQRATESQQYVTVVTTSCNSGSGSCGAYAYFYGYY